MKNIPQVLKIFISVLSFSLIFRLVQGADFTQMLKEVDLPYLLMSVALSVMMVGISCLKWHVLLAHQGSPVSYSILLQYYLIGYYFTTLLPSNMGGDAVRSYYAGKRIGSQTRAAVSVVLLIGYRGWFFFWYWWRRRPCCTRGCTGTALYGFRHYWLSA